MSNRRNELIDIRDEYDLTRQQIAKMTGASIHSVNSWFNPTSSVNSRDIPENLLRLLRFEAVEDYNRKIKRGSIS